MEDSDTYAIFTAEDRSELLFRVFSHITLGGPVNQVDIYTPDLFKYPVVLIHSMKMS